jgi:ABC-type nitrate/sulfonate/bicarbonate transport system ATPase subunit
MEPIIDCCAVGKRFRKGDSEFTALENVNLSFRSHCFTALVGASGCGKTTLLNIVSGLDTAFDGEVVSKVDPLKIGYVFQNPRLLPWLSALDNVLFVLQPRGITKRDATRIALEHLQLVGLNGFEHQFPSQLSGGMRQRVALARALALEPELMIMDEPFGSLDELTARRLRLELLRLFGQLQKTVIFVTHNVTEAIFLADEVVVMGTNPGHIVAQIPVDLPRPRIYESAEIAKIARDIIQQLKL